MAANTIAMGTLKQILRLYEQSVPIKTIVRVTNISRNTVKHYIRLFQAQSEPIAGLLKLEWKFRIILTPHFGAN